MTDDLDRGAIVNEYTFDEMLQLTFAAGNDLAMICHRIDKARKHLELLKQLPRKQIKPRPCQRGRFQKQDAAANQVSESAFRKLDDAVWKLSVGGSRRRTSRRTQPRERRPLARRTVLEFVVRRSVERIVRDLSTSLRSAQDDKGRTCGVRNGAIARCPIVTCLGRREGAGTSRLLNSTESPADKCDHSRQLKPASSGKSSK